MRSRPARGPAGAFPFEQGGKLVGHRAGLEAPTGKGFSATGIDEILLRVGVPKGSFFHYFDSREAFGLALIDRYGEFFAAKLDRHLLNRTLTPLARLHAFIDDAKSSMARLK